MKIQKRDGSFVVMKFDKITQRLKNLMTTEMKRAIDVELISQKVIDSLYDGIQSTEIDALVAETAVGMSTIQTEYEDLAARVVASSIRKQIPMTFSDAMWKLREAEIISEDLWNSIETIGRSTVNEAIVHARDMQINFFGLKTLEKSYLQRLDGKLMESPQYLWMRVSLGIHGDDWERAKETYELMSQGFFTHATPTLFNAGTPKPQMSSCFLVAMKDDSIDGIYKTAHECAQISKWAGGIGMHIHNVRGDGSHIKGTNGTSSGIIPMLRVFNATARYVNQAGRRKGSIAVYIEPWHSDIEAFLDLRLNQGDEEARCRDLFSALWIPDLFMERVQDGGKWSLFSPDDTKDLPELYGDAFKEAYERYEQEGKAMKTMDAHTLWQRILRSQVETGTPYMLFKDPCNEKSNQKNLGTIKCSNLCTEIVEYTDKDETAVCNLASIALPKFVNPKTKKFNYQSLIDVSRTVTRNLNKVIDRNFYPTEPARKSNMRHRPIGIGVQGLADTYILMDMAFDSEEARELNHKIFEAIYYGSVMESMEEAKKYGAYETFEGSPASKGILQFDMWEPSKYPLNQNWDELKEKVKKHGMRNSLLLAPMPTASTSQILGNNECIEPYTSNMYLRRTLAGEFVVINKHLIKELISLGIWNNETKNAIIRDNGSVQNLTIPDELKAKYKTVWEMSQKTLIDQAADRGRFVCQSQSLNLFLEDPNTSRISSMHMYAWKQGLKTGMYYLRTRPKARAVQFTVDPVAKAACTIENKDDCVMCSA
ncbi:MAG: ribonucleoside-diphosphate reductase subunit alpha [Sedimenticolaceae bacterium]